MTQPTSNMITRNVIVNRNRSAKEALKSTKIRLYYNFDPKVKKLNYITKEKVFFFKIGHEVTAGELEKEYALRRLKPADLHSISAVNEARPDFSKEYPNATQWKDDKGKWHFAVFCISQVGNKCINIGCIDSLWEENWWFAGVLN